MSCDIRWSLDLRWQRSSDPDGLWGLKKPVIMRKNGEPNYQIDWTEFNSVDRHVKQKQAAEGTAMVGSRSLYFYLHANIWSHHANMSV